MLTVLHIENIAVIESADIEFQPGLNILTGETGAGKSILIDSLGAVLGERASKDIVRSGAASGAVSAIFSPVSEQALQWMSQNGLDTDTDELLITREIGGDGRSVCRVNGNPFTVNLLKTLGSLLLNIHGQHSGQQLLSESTHLGYLDSFADSSDLLERYSTAYRDMLEARRKVESLHMDEDEKQRRAESLRYRIDEITSAELEAGEEEELLRERDILRNAGKISEALENAYLLFEGDDDSPCVSSGLYQASNSLSGISEFSDELGAIYERVEEMMYGARDIAGDLQALLGDYDYSVDDLDDIEGRLDLISRLRRKYGVGIPEILELLESFGEELEDLELSDERLEKLNRELEDKTLAAEELAQSLSQKRKSAALELERSITRELSQLDMSKVSFSIDISTGELGPSGRDNARFLISTNAGEPLRPLAKIASGGELSRVMLALKNVLSSGDSVSTLVFDEVDSGVSGRAALKVGSKLAEVARSRQVLCVTHLPQIAAAAGTHFCILKTESGGRTMTRVERLDLDGRVDELARLIGGAVITDTTRSSAMELIQANIKVIAD